ncbi:ubinuclein-2-like isoform X2 [Rhodnius prolixus]|uniref:ubinuclein-2-like isoform X2 n=1 Tax=Rhodnius prolixus TaxID=13249 RepID=UPI003D18AC62
MDSSERVIESINSSKFTMKKCHSKTIRLTVDLSQTDKDGCAIFNYQDLVKAEKEKLNIVYEPKQLNGASDLFNSEDEEALKKIALQYEEKYGGGSNMRYQTYTELGAGYDENDSFIDNTEAVEEALPDNTEPKRGGFYVNTGKLEYKKVYDYFDIKKVKRKRLLESESEDDDETSSEEKRTRGDGRNEKADRVDERDSKISNGKRNNKPNKMAQMKTVDEVSKESIKPAHGKIHSGSSSSDTKGPSVSNESSNCTGADVYENSAQIDVKNPPLDKVHAAGYKGQNSDLNEKTEHDSGDTNAAISNSETSNSADRDVFQKDEPPKLPELSPEILVVINELKSLAGNFKSSQRKFFTDPTNTLLYRLESTCRKELSNSGRHAVYSYLAHFLPFTKSTLVSRIKKIFVGNGQLESFIIRIKNVVTSFPKINDDYELQRQSLEEAKPYLEKAVQIKVRQFVVMTGKKKDSLETYIVDFLSNIVPFWPCGTITVSNLHNLVVDAIKMEAEAYNMTYSPGFPFLKDSTSPAMTFNDILFSQSKKNTASDEEPAVSKSLPVVSTADTATASSKEIKVKEDTQLAPMTVPATTDKEKVSVVLKVSHKKQKSSGSKRDSGRWPPQQGTKKLDERILERDPESRDKHLSKYCSADEKVQMQLDQVMQDLVVLNQMSSDTTCSTNNK